MTVKYLERPQYLAPLDATKAENDFTVLTNRETIGNLAKSICNALRHPVTILDINRLGTASCKGLRIDSDIEFFALRITCRLLRHCASCKMCHQCDEYHASLFKGNPEELQSRISDAIKEPPSFFYDGYINRPPILLEGFPRPVLEYYCPILGYRELILPIFHRQIVIGALFVGQTMVHEMNDDATKQDIMSSFFSKTDNSPEIIFNDFLQKRMSNIESVDILPETIMKALINADELTEPIDRFFRLQPIDDCDGEILHQASMTFDKKSQYDQFIKNACEILEITEQSLDLGMQEKQKKHFENITQDVVQSFFDNQSIKTRMLNELDQNTLRRKQLHHAWNGFYEAAELIKELLGLEDVVLFGDGMRLYVEENKKKGLYPHPAASDSHSAWYFDFSRVKNHYQTTYDSICSLDTPDVLDGLSAQVDIENTILLVYPDVVVLLHVKDLKKNLELYSVMAEVIGKGFSRIRSSVALCAANYMKERHVLTLRMNRHESAHISTRLNDTMQRYFANKGQAFLTLSADKQEYVVDDMQNTIWLISHMADNIGLITGSINASTIQVPEKNFDVYNMLFKWQNMFKKRLEERNLNLIVARSAEGNIPFYLNGGDYDAPGNIKTNPDLFELMIYNLIDNAVKYAYRGSIICTRWCRTKTYPQNILSVSSFGPEIKDTDNIYDLYTRGNISHLHAVEGDGIGLFVAKRVEALLHQTLLHECTHYAPYNLPLISWYIAESFSDPDEKAIQAQLISYMQSKHNFVWKDVINELAQTRITRRDLSKEYLTSRIRNETWLTTFYVIIPDSI